MSSNSDLSSDDGINSNPNTTNSCANDKTRTIKCKFGDKCRNPDTCGFYHNDSDRRDISKMKPCGNCKYCNRPKFVFTRDAQNTRPNHSGSKPSHDDSKNVDLYKTIAEQTMEIQRLKTENERLKNLLKNKKH